MQIEKYSFNKIQEKLQQTLDPARYEHTLGVMYTAGCLAMAHDYPMEKAMLAGLLHDCAKRMPFEEMVQLCESHKVEITPTEFENKGLLHAKAGAILAETEYSISDEEILHAIAIHTTGEPDMSVLDKIIYIADYIEPGRKEIPGLRKARQLAFVDLNICMAEITGNILEYLQSGACSIDPRTELTYHFYEQYRKE